MPPGQEQYPCIPDLCRKTANSGSGDDQTATCAQKNYKYMPSRCRETTECSAPQCSTGYRPPPGCCKPPGQEQYPCYPDPCPKETPQCSTGYRPPPGCCKPPGQEQYPCYPDPSPKEPPQCSTGYRPPPGCCKPPGQEQYPCYPDPCPKEPSQCSTGYRPPPGCCKPPGQEQYPCYPDPSPKEPPQCSTGYRPPPGCCKPPDPCGKTAKQTHVCTRETYEFAPSRCALKTNACSTGYRPPQGCCMPPGQEHRPCMPDPCTKTANSDTCLNNTPLYDRLKYEFAPSRCPLKTKECAPSQCCKGYRPPPGCCMPPGQEQYPCIPDPCTKTANSDTCLNNTPLYDRMKYEFAPSQCPLKTKECAPSQCCKGYRLPPGCCKPPGQEQYPCIPEPCYNQPMQCTRKKCTEPDVALAMGYGAPIGQRVTPSNCSW